MSRFEDRIAAPPALPPMPPRPPRRREEDPPEEPVGRLPLWVKRATFEPMERAGVKFRGVAGDRRRFGAKTLRLTTCIVLKVVPPGARRSAQVTGKAIGGPRSKHLPLIKRAPRFRTKAERKRHLRWWHGVTREREYLLRGPGCVTFAAARSMMLRTQWTVTFKLVVRSAGEGGTEVKTG